MVLILYQLITADSALPKLPKLPKFPKLPIPAPSTPLAKQTNLSTVLQGRGG